MSTTDQKEFLEAQLKRIIKKDLQAKWFMEWTGATLSDIYSVMETDEDTADHLFLLFYYFIENMSDGEVEKTLDSIFEVFDLEILTTQPKEAFILYKQK